MTFRADLAHWQAKTAAASRRLVLILGLAGLLAAAAALYAGWFVIARDLPPAPDQKTLWSLNRAPSMTFLDRTGAVIATRGPRYGKRAVVAELPPYVTGAFLAAEDRRFYDHGPVEMRGILRAFVANFQAGDVVQGGSTLTQQLAKTLFLTPDQTLRRKLQEAVMAYRLEAALSKTAILELYINRIYFGANAYGLEAASQGYFSKPASQLTPAEAALLGALPKAPSRLAPTRDYASAVQRSHLILAAMRQEGWITAAQQAYALAHPPQLKPSRRDEGDWGYLLDQAAAEALDRAGSSAPDLVVQITIDPILQAAAVEAVRSVMTTKGPGAQAHQAALTALDRDGAIRALVGGVDHQASPFNRAVQARRQPGSAFKPFIYAAAVEQGVKASDLRLDAPLHLGPWSPKNYGGGYSGFITVGSALARSVNTVAVRLAREVGVEQIGNLSHRFGLDTIPSRPNLSVALGAYEVGLLDLTGAYQVFQSGGLRTPPYLIAQITTSGGELLYRNSPEPPARVYDVANAGEMVRMLTGVITRGTGTGADIGRLAAGKTGTSQDWRDAWFVGFTPDWICGVWVGNDDGQPMKRVTGGDLPAQIWQQFMLKAHENLPPSGFDWQVDAPEVKDAVPDRRETFYETLSAEFEREASEGLAPDEPLPDEVRDIPTDPY